MIRLIATDLDGTLLSDHETISEENLGMIRRAMADGITFAVASGRWAVSCSRLMVRYGLDSPIIAVNGGHLLSGPNGETLSLHPMNRTLAAECMRIFEAHALHGCLSTKEGIVYSSLEALCYYEGFAAQNGKPIGRTHAMRHGKSAVESALLGTPLKAFCAFSKGQETAFGQARAACEKLPGVSLTSSWANNFEVMPEGVNKATGLSELAARLGISRDEVMAFGDNENDLEMLKWAGIGVAMGNAKETIKQTADYVTKACFEAGVAHAIGRFVFPCRQETHAAPQEPVQYSSRIHSSRKSSADKR